jgi:hypothetical protein
MHPVKIAVIYFYIPLGCNAVEINMPYVKSILHLPPFDDFVIFLIKGSLKHTHIL